MTVEYYRLMLFQNILTSPKERLGRVILQDQMASTTGTINWYTETKKIAKRIGVQLEMAENVKKETWKKTVKQKILKDIEVEANRKGENMRKTRHQKGQEYQRKGYLNRMDLRESSKTMRRRLEMLDIGNNFGRNRK